MAGFVVYSLSDQHQVRVALLKI